MTDGLNPINSLEKSKTISSIDSSKSLLDKDSDSSKRLAADLLKESDRYSADSQGKGEQAREYLHAADVFDAMAKAVRDKANQLRNNEINSDSAVEEVKNIVQVPGQTLEFPIPKDATPEDLEQIASALEKKAQDNRRKADELLMQSEESARFAKELKGQVDRLSRKEAASDMDSEIASGHNKGLDLVFKKLGINRLDNEYKEQVALSESMSQQSKQLN